MIRRPPVGGSGARRIWSAYDERVGQVASRRWGGLDNRAQCRRCVGPAPVGRIIDEQFPQVLVTPVQAGHDGADWGAHDVGDFLVSEALDVGEIDHYPELLGQRLQGLADVGVGQPLQGWRPAGFSSLELWEAAWAGCQSSVSLVPERCGSRCRVR
jgi:hypothetical protein